MSFLERLEKISERYIEGLFKGKSTDTIQPVEMAKKISREMRDGKTISVNKVYVPNSYKICLSPHDWETYEAVTSSLAKDLSQFATSKAAEKKFAMVGKPVITFDVDENLSTGHCRVIGKYIEAVADKMPEIEVENIKMDPKEDTLVAMKGNLAKFTVEKEPLLRVKAALEIKEGLMAGKIIPVSAENITIGRLEQNDVVLPDHNISRRHARLEYYNGGFVVTDLGSTNGTLVNNERISKATLKNGDHLRMGKTLMEFRVD